ncbi:MAG: hypothetical protein IJX08_05445, partial [Clostridia bacterium]|nr:hypothetical protein [Clostridia bacterium]
MKNLQNLFDTACPQELNALLKSLPEPTLPPDVAGRISANACRKADIQPIRTAKKRKIVYVISATASVLVLLAGILTLMILQTPPPQPTEPISTEPIFTDPTESAATPKSPTQAPSPSQSTPEKELPPANTLEDLWAQYTEESFIWGEETEGGSFGGEGLGDSSEDNSNKEWNGLTVSAALYRELTNNLPQTLYAIGADSLLPITLPYEDFVYEGKTTAEFNAEYKKIYHTWEQVVRLKRIVFLAEQDGADQYHELDWLAESAEQIFRTTDPEILEKYSNGKDLNKELIRADSDVNYAELEKIKQKRNERTAAWRDQYYVYPNFAEFINAGYYVVQNDRYFFLITDAQGLSKLADVIKEQNLDPTLLTKTVYRKANGKELGLP